eukprot:13604276-Alexandrium_andersonii.AAC.1
MHEQACVIADNLLVRQCEILASRVERVLMRPNGGVDCATLIAEEVEELVWWTWCAHAADVGG